MTKQKKYNIEETKRSKIIPLGITSHSRGQNPRIKYEYPGGKPTSGKIIVTPSVGITLGLMDKMVGENL